MNRNLFIALVTLVVGMIMLAFASAPLYSIFCKATGFEGTPRIAIGSQGYSQKIGARDITLEFDANLDPRLNWYFKPEQRRITVKPGENTIVFYKVKNYSNEDVFATAVYNVTPQKAAPYFYKIHCFCFEEQLIKANAEILLPVSFYIDPDIENETILRDVHNITLSYTFYKISPSQPKVFQ